MRPFREVFHAHRRRRMGLLVEAALDRSQPAVLSGSREELAGVRRLDRGIDAEHKHIIDPQTSERIRAVHAQVSTALHMAVAALADGDTEKALAVVGMKTRLNRLVAETAEHQRQRLLADAPNRIETYRLETELVQYLRRIDTFTRRLGRGILPGGALEEGLGDEAA